MGSYEYLEHTADLGVIGHGKDMADALAWLAVGMFSSMIELESIVPRDTIELTVDSGDPESLAVDWLNELLFRFEADGFVPTKFDVTVSESNSSLEAKCIGETADPQKHRFLTAVKAATYHDLKVTHNDGWHFQVILDI